MEHRYWYLAYGSNMSARGLARYVGEGQGQRPSRELQVSRELYFAGESPKWGGGVAFISPTDSLTSSVYARAYLVTAAELNQIFHGENGCEESLPSDLDSLNIEVGGCREIPMAPSSNPARGKYNAVVRFGDHDGAPTYSFTTTRTLPRRPPDQAYRDTIYHALTPPLSPEVAQVYLAEAIARSQ